MWERAREWLKRKRLFAVLAFLDSLNYCLASVGVWFGAYKYWKVGDNKYMMAIQTVLLAVTVFYNAAMTLQKYEEVRPDVSLPVEIILFAGAMSVTAVLTSLGWALGSG
jgi:hypothetical protein